MHDCNPAPQVVDCVDAPASTSETMAEAAARVARATSAGRNRWDEREIARSALGDLPEDARAEFLTDLLCELRGPGARTALSLARNRLTAYLRDLITQEYDAQVATMPGQDVAQLARGSV